MDENISVSSDGGGEVGVLGHRETVVTDVSHIDSRHAEIDGLVHTSSRHNSDDLIKLRILSPDCLIKTLCKLLRRLSTDLEAILSELVYQLLELLLLWKWMSTQDCKARVEGRQSLCDGNIGKEHEFFNHEVGVDVLVL